MRDVAGAVSVYDFDAAIPRSVVPKLAYADIAELVGDQHRA
jgi:hypothetical protein